MNIYLQVVYVMVKRACYLHVSNCVREKQKFNLFMAIYYIKLVYFWACSRKWRYFVLLFDTSG